MKSIGILGVGELTEKMVRGLIEADPDANILLSPRNTVRANALSETLSCAVMSSNQEVIDNADTIVIGVRPDALETLAREVTFRSDQAVVSLAAGVNLERLQNLFGHPRIVRMMLTYAAEINATTVVLTQCDDSLSDQFVGLGDLLVTENEHSFELATVGMCMNGWFYAFAGQMQDWFVLKGMREQDARRLVLGAMRDCSAYGYYSQERSLDELAKSIATPGTFTAQGQAILDELHSHSSWETAAEAVLSALNAGNEPEKA